MVPTPQIAAPLFHAPIEEKSTRGPQIKGAAQDFAKEPNYKGKKFSWREIQGGAHYLPEILRTKLEGAITWGERKGGIQKGLSHGRKEISLEKQG
ncbi:hypothetical protein ACEW7V_01470 [Areca yellow leaf disease phytoplasma]|uniref:hypothetical protein n=1 Tax=Areca yellow leaf disease phytoplasma TaxID=927614 RepID=UPI0035B4FD21